jgi:cytidylate kinase
MQCNTLPQYHNTTTPQHKPTKRTHNATEKEDIVLQSEMEPWLVQDAKNTKLHLFQVKPRLADGTVGT